MARSISYSSSRLLLAGMMALLLGLMSSEMASAGERERKIERCQFIKDKIEYYTDRRRGGGSSGQMRSWQSQRNDYKQRYRDENCTRVRAALK
ncbi:hypothetical protein [Cobetia sp. 1CM21F]|uniref:hypothetical protein n=1 Tax=Cobetia sp. 1CM21F TaxID=2929163 RepID=UPI0020BF975A|nr:hypothetical protein [Cobetia sp. 1CM21F]MCK8069396.1 hypothetical protein [Cobetia sp. 1CM21F]